MATNAELIALFGDDFQDVLAGLQSLPAEARELLDRSMAKMLFDAEVFGSRVNKAVQGQKIAGISDDLIKAGLLEDMQSGGRVFGEIRNQVKGSLVEGINQSSRAGTFQALDPESDTLFTWITVAGHKICKDCEPRGGQRKTLREWEELGLPASGWSVCRGYCYCILDPSGKISPRLEVKGVAEKGATVKKLKITDFKMAGKHTNIKDAIAWMEKNGVIEHDVKKMDLLWVNEINSAISKMPTTYRSNLVVGDFNFFRKVTGRSFKKHELKNYGVSMQIDGFDANILTLSEKIAYRKQLDVFGKPRQLPTYNVVGINTTKYSVPKKMTERKAIINKAYKEKTGNNWGFNKKGETTVHHEFGHVVHNGLYGQLSSEWDSIAKTWAKKENYDLLNVQTSWAESYGEAFAEAWGAYHSENKKRLPENVIKFIEKVL